MAKATKVIHRIERSEEELRRRDLESIETQLLDHKEAIDSLFEILKHLKDRGVLEMVTALFAQGDKVMDILVKTVDNDETTNTMKNLLLMLGTLGTLNVQQLEPLILKVNTGIARIAELDEKEGKMGYFTLLRTLNDPDVKRAMAVGVAFMKGLGEKEDDLERTTQSPEEQAHKKTEKRKAEVEKANFGNEPTSIPSEESKRGKHDKGGTGWMIVAAAISILSIPVTLSFKKDNLQK